MTKTTHSISAIQAFNDNYIWAINATKTNKVVFVDPGDADVCLQYLKKHQLELCAILITHHHNDHTGGIKALIDNNQKNHLPLTVYGPKSDGIKYLDYKLKEQDAVYLEEIDLQLSVLDLPGHTHGHIAYVSDEFLFCGDTLFSGGCGRLFEGTAQEMHHSLQKLAALPDSTKVFCAHEYTLANLTFALTVEPNNQQLIDYQDKVQQMRNKSKATIPTTIGTEKAINPFLRCHTCQVIQSAQANSNQTLTLEHETFAALRAWKDKF